MSFLTNKELKPLLKKGISDNKFDEDRLQNASYELTLGDEVYTNSDDSKTILSIENPQFEIKPGQFAILITDEEISITNKHIGFISLKFGFKFKGLVNISGFHVDPGFKGKLKFSVYNAGSNSIILDRGAAYFVLWISELKSELEEENSYKGTHQGQNSITADDVMKIKGEIASPNQLLAKINDVDSNLNIRINRVDSKKDRNWWAQGIILAVALGIALKIFWDWAQFEEGYKKALLDNEQKIEERSVILKELENTISFKIDSINKVKQDLKLKQGDTLMKK